MKILKNQSGVALMIVLGALLILTTIGVEFAYNSHVTYELASSERERLQAYYLARSGYNLIRLELRVENQLRTQYGDLLQNLQGSGVTADPLCKQLPLSTGLLKGVTSGALLGGAGEEDSEGEAEPAPTETPKVGEVESGEGTEGFFNFNGDFEVSCDSEERKINLNVFRNYPPVTADTIPPAPPASGSPTSSAASAQLYEDQKNMLFSLLSQKEFEPLFKGKPDEIRRVVNNIADWADRDDRVSEAPGISGGPEDSEYGGSEFHYKVKNGKYTSVAELLLVAGVGDDLFRKLEPNVTVYGDNKINICQASDEMIKAFVYRFLQGSLIVINPEDEERWSAIIEGVRSACSQPSPQPSAIATAVGQATGLTNTSAMAGQIVTKNRFYRIESIGTVGENRLKIVGVFDTQGNPSAWKTLYFRVE